MATAIGIDIGGTNIKGVVLNAAGKIIQQTVQATPSDTSGENGHLLPWKQAVAQMLQQLKDACAGRIDTIGLAAPGLPNPQNTAIRLMPDRLQGLENLIWMDYLQEPEVWVLNDAAAALMAEASFGAGKGLKNIVMLTLGTGVGGSLFINGTLYQGNYQMAGHLGHMTLDADRDEQGITGMPGTLEAAIGNSTVAKRSLGRFETTDALVKAHVQGDYFATYVWLHSVRKLALGICSLCHLLSPDLVILGGGITKAGDALYQPLHDFIDIYEWKQVGEKIPIQQAHFSDMAGAIGAAAFALGKLPATTLPSS